MLKKIPPMYINAVKYGPLQRDGVEDRQASHIAYIENGHRTPSISLINRRDKTLGLNTEELLVLAHSEARQNVFGNESPEKARDGSWRQFASNQALLRRYAVTPAELNLLNRFRCSSRSPIQGI
jgi:hypothetical protein